jgi:hypothetical protein
MNSLAMASELSEGPKKRRMRSMLENNHIKMLKLRYQYARSIYFYHFIGDVNYRADYDLAIGILTRIRESVEQLELGGDHYAQLCDTIDYALENRLE